MSAVNNIPQETPTFPAATSEPPAGSKIERSTSAALSAMSALSLREEPSSPLPDFVDLSNPAVLQTYLAPELQEHILECAQVAKFIYEARLRAIADNQYGMAFPMNPEILAYAMRLVKNKIGIEIAAARGENAILLAAAGAKKVYVNDITHEEMATFREYQQSLSSAISNRLVPVEGDCFKILEMRPKLFHKVDLILCRNLLHFFPDERQSEFLEMIKKMLKPGGRAIFTINSIYAYVSENKSVLDENPDATSFTVTQCFVADYRYGSGIRAVLLRHLTPCAESLASSAFTAHHLYERGPKTQGKWKVDNDEFMKIDAKIRPLIQEAVKNNKEYLKTIPAGSLRISISHLRYYSTQTLPLLFENHGFEVEHVFVIEGNGHLTQDLSKGVLTGAIVRYQG